MVQKQPGPPPRSTPVVHPTHEGSKPRAMKPGSYRRGTSTGTSTSTSTSSASTRGNTNAFYDPAAAAAEYDAAVARPVRTVDAASHIGRWLLVTVVAVYLFLNPIAVPEACRRALQSVLPVSARRTLTTMSPAHSLRFVRSILAPTGG